MQGISVKSDGNIIITELQGLSLTFNLNNAVSLSIRITANEYLVTFHKNVKIYLIPAIVDALL